MGQDVRSQLALWLMPIGPFCRGVTHHSCVCGDLDTVDGVSVSGGSHAHFSILPGDTMKTEVAVKEL